MDGLYSNLTVDKLIGYPDAVVLDFLLTIVKGLIRQGVPAKDVAIQAQMILIQLDNDLVAFEQVAVGEEGLSAVKMVYKDWVRPEQGSEEEKAWAAKFDLSIAKLKPRITPLIILATKTELSGGQDLKSSSN